MPLCLGTRASFQQKGKLRGKLLHTVALCLSEWRVTFQTVPGKEQRRAVIRLYESRLTLQTGRDRHCISPGFKVQFHQIFTAVSEAVNSITEPSYLICKVGTRDSAVTICTACSHLNYLIQFLIHLINALFPLFLL